MNGSTPVVTTSVSVNTITVEVSVNGSYSGMTSPVGAAHIHGLAPPGAATGILITLTQTGGTSGSLGGGGTLSASDLTGLLDGSTYINVHTANNGPGEIRGQIADPDILVFNNVYISHRQSVPTPNLNGSSPSGTARVVVDTGTGDIEIAGMFTGMTGDVTAAHIHGLAGPGAAVGVIFPLAFDNGTGSFSGSSTLDAGNLAGLLDGNTYINLHTAMNGPGERRGQVPDPVTLGIVGLGTAGLLIQRRRQT